MIQRDVENNLARYRLAAPRAGLRAQVIENAFARKQTGREERLLPWAVAVLAVTLVWAHFQEDRTAQRMASAAAASANAFARQAEPQESPAMAALPIHPRMSLPLPEGCASTRIRITILSLDAARLAFANGAPSSQSLTSTGPSREPVKTMTACVVRGLVTADLEIPAIQRRKAPCRFVRFLSRQAARC